MKGIWRTMRLPMSAGLLAGGLLCLMPLLWVPGPTKEERPAVLPASPAPVESAPGEAEAVEGKDRAQTVAVLMDDGTVEELSLADYLWSVVAAEMPASFEEDALRAQAVCARTYTAWKAAAGRHGEADICADSSCCQAYISPEDAAARWGEAAEAYTGKIASAVADTDGVILTYEGKPIQAVFFSSSAQRTEDAAAVWGSALPYLVSVDSPEGEEVPNYRSTVTLTREEAEALVKEAYPDAELPEALSRWFSNVTYTASGRVESLEVGGITLSGGAARSLFSLRSACFQVETEGEEVIFTVTGYGHGVGMSQYGANAMAKAGSSWEEILLHYYTGVSLEKG